MDLPARRLSGRRIWKLEAALLAAALLVIGVTPVRVVADQVAPVRDERAVAKSVVVILPFTVCPTCQLTGVLAEVQADPADAARVHATLGKRLDADVYATVTGGRATMTQLTGKPSRLDILELYNSSGLLAQAVRAADGSYEIALRQPKSGGQPGAKTLAPPTWGTKIEMDPADGSQSVTLATRSLGSVQEGTADDQPGILVVRCVRGKMTVVIAWPRFLGLRKGQTIEWRLDASPWVSEYWAISTDGRGLKGPWSVSFLKRLYAAKKLAVRVTPYGLPVQTLEFRLDGLEDEAGPLREACNIR